MGIPLKPNPYTPDSVIAAQALSEGNLENQDFGGNRGSDESHMSCKQEFAMHTRATSELEEVRLRWGAHGRVSMGLHGSEGDTK